MGLKRYLIYLSYIGTYFRGVQRQMSRAERHYEDPSTVQGLLEFALERMKPSNTVKVLLSSRTDQGVHAIKSAVAVDLDLPYEPKPESIHHFLNRFFDDTDLPIRVQDVFQVPWEFDPRRLPLWRKYIYRFAIVKPGILPEKRDTKFTIPIPITEHNRCYFVRNSKFDVEAVHKTCELFVGTKDFISFMGKPKNQPQDLTTIRCMHRVFVEPANPYIPTEYNDYYNYWNLVCEGKSFLYNQVRRTVSVLLAVGQGRLTYDDVEQMFVEPSPNCYPHDLVLAPAYGLYLADIFYDPRDLALPTDIKEKINEPEVQVMREKTKKEMILERLELIRLRKQKYSTS